MRQARFDPVDAPIQRLALPDAQWSGFRWHSDCGVLMSSTAFAYPQVVSRRFTYFRVARSDVSAGQRDFCSGFDSRQLHQTRRSG
jgi:hypothetical protein